MVNRVVEWRSQSGRTVHRDACVGSRDRVLDEVLDTPALFQEASTADPQTRLAVQAMLVRRCRTASTPAGSPPRS